MFQLGIRKLTFFPSALQKGKKRRRFRFIASVLACTSIKRWFWTLTRGSQWFEIVETTFQNKSVVTLHSRVTTLYYSSSTLYYSSSTVEYRTIANLFGVSTSFFCLCIRDVCKATTKS